MDLDELERLRRDPKTLVGRLLDALPELISRARAYEVLDQHARDQVAEIDRLRVRLADADRDRDTWATSAHKIANERDAIARDLAAAKRWAVESDEEELLKRHSEIVIGAFDAGAQAGLQDSMELKVIRLIMDWREAFATGQLEATREINQLKRDLAAVTVERDAARAEGIGTMDLDELERLHREATGAPWRCVEHSYGGRKVVNDEAVTVFLPEDFRLIAAMRNALPALLQAARELPALKHSYDRADEELVAVIAERDAARAECRRLRGLFEMTRYGICDRLGLNRGTGWFNVENSIAQLRTRLAEVERERDAARAALTQMHENERLYQRRPYQEMQDALIAADRERRIAEVQRDASYAKGREDGIASLESLAEDAQMLARRTLDRQTEATDQKLVDAARRVLAGIGGK